MNCTQSYSSQARFAPALLSEPTQVISSLFIPVTLHSRGFLSACYDLINGQLGNLLYLVGNASKKKNSNIEEMINMYTLLLLYVLINSFRFHKGSETVHK